jgi:hypothetical protein
MASGSLAIFCTPNLFSLSRLPRIMVLCLLLSLCYFLVATNGLRLLDAVRKDAELSIFAGLIDGTSSGIPNPGMPYFAKTLLPIRADVGRLQG